MDTQDQSDETSPGFSRSPPPEERPGFDPSNSPLQRGGEPGTARPTPADAALRGLTEPGEVGRTRVMFRVRREGWVARRNAARHRFASLGDQKGNEGRTRALGGLRSRGGLLARSKKNAVRARFNLRRCR